MDLSWWRDLAIVVWAGIATIALIIISIIVLLMYRRLVPLMESAGTVMQSADIVVNKIGDVVDYTREEVISPVVRVGSAVQGIAQGIGLIADLFRKKEKQHE
jgi:NADH:ubiquinone oxidoreductase subunit K